MTITYGIAFVFSAPAGAATDYWGRGSVGAWSMVLFTIGHAGLAAMCLFDSLYPSSIAKVSLLMASAVFLGAADALSGPLGYVLKSDSAAQEEQRLKERGNA